ncbi:MAG: membrane protein insertase YidC [Acidobacteriota bacterium]|nr:MAG: membrane protein insertase YidC [Acidobacteriota bacterium]
MEEKNQGNQSRFLLAAILSMAVLFIWSYFFAPKPVPPDNTNTAANTAATQPAPTEAPSPTPPAESAAVEPDTLPARSVKISSPLYEVTFDSKGALATSWIIKKNKSPKAEFPIFADGSTPDNEKPLQLISQQALASSPREIPFRLATGDAAADTLLNDRNYEISIPDENITLNPGEEREVKFTLRGAGVIEAEKTFVFKADSYVADLAVKVKKNGETMPNTKLLIGASIGDHAINHHTFYNIESESIAAIDGDIYRHQGNYSFTYDANEQATLADKGQVSWAGVGDAYFAMVAVPAAPVQGVEYKAARYEVETQPYFQSIFQWILRNAQTSEKRHLVTVHLPIQADGSPMQIFTGAKDYFLLRELDEQMSARAGRELEIVNLINFSNYRWLRWMTKPLSIPILYALNFFNTLTHNYGVAIVVFTFLFYSLLFPLRWKQSRSFKKAASNAPKMKELQDRLKAMQKKGIPNDDPRMRELQMEQLKLTKDALPLGGCLPMLLQFPLLIAFYTAVTVSLEARQASFLWLPDLSAADPWHILEFAFAASMVLAMKFTPTGAAVTPEQQMQQKMMTYFMPAMMLWVLWAAPSGLLLYWFTGNIVSFGQQMIINRMNKSDDPPGTQVVSTVPAGAKKVKAKPA